jgi:hypothetical protein
MDGLPSMAGLGAAEHAPRLCARRPLPFDLRDSCNSRREVGPLEEPYGGQIESVQTGGGQMMVNGGRLPSEVSRWGRSGVGGCYLLRHAAVDSLGYNMLDAIPARGDGMTRSCRLLRLGR